MCSQMDTNGALTACAEENAIELGSLAREPSALADLAGQPSFYEIS
jgi:hypothetical protein